MGVTQNWKHIYKAHTTWVTLNKRTNSMEEDWGGDMQMEDGGRIEMVGQKEKETIPTHTPRDSIMIFMKWGNKMIRYEVELSHKFGFLCEIHGII